MKKILSTILLVSVYLMTQAQTPVLTPRDGRLDGYHYTWCLDECWYYSDTCSFYEYITNRTSLYWDPWIVEYGALIWDSTQAPRNATLLEYTEYPMAITGLGVLQYPSAIDEPLGRKPGMPEYVIIIQKAADSLIFLDTIRWDTAAPKILRIPKNRDSLGLTDTNGYRIRARGYMEFPFYEVTLPTPVVVDSTFFLLGTLNSNEYNQTTHRYETCSPKVYPSICEGNANHLCGLRYPGAQMEFNFNLGVLFAGDPREQMGNVLAKRETANLDLFVDDYEMGRIQETSGIRSKWTYQTITAIHNYGYRFLYWNDFDTNNPRQVYITQDTAFTAYFIPIGLHSVRVACNNDDYGQVTGGGIFETGDTTMIYATPNYGYRFRCWNDGDTNNPRKVYVSHDTTFTAIFYSIGIYNVTLKSNDSVFVVVTGGGTFEGGDSTVIRARFIPYSSEWDSASHYWMAFRTWDDGVAANPRQIFVTSDTVITAIFYITDTIGIPQSIGATSHFALTPNPARQYVDVQIIEGNEQHGVLTITDAMGRNVRQLIIRGDNTRIDLKGFARGVYLITLQTPQGKSTQRLTVVD